MAKKGTAKPKTRPAKPERKRTETPPKQARGSRARGSRPNGKDTTPPPPPADKKIPITQAMKEAIAQLGERTIPMEAEILQANMNKLADILEDLTGRRAVMDAKGDEYRTAKKSVETCEELLRETLRSFTHAKPLPLFDAPRAERDQRNMLDAAERGGKDPEAGAEAGESD